jgi:hypothetical protein
MKDEVGRSKVKGSIPGKLKFSYYVTVLVRYLLDGTNEKEGAKFFFLPLAIMIGT